jgi:ElaB/YqjD/DUF883 family membrane-anchored ribosome-binding protein
MGYSENANGNGAAHRSQRQPQEPMSLADHGRQIHHDAEVLAAAVRDATDGVQRYLTAQVEQRPFSTVGVAAGIGYVLGGGLSARLTAMLLGAAARVATALVARELGTRILHGDAAWDQTRAPEDASGAAKERS